MGEYRTDRCVFTQLTKTSRELLLKQADEAMDQVKTSGKCGIVFSMMQVVDNKSSK
jgi:hypothetical protein